MNFFLGVTVPTACYLAPSLFLHVLYPHENFLCLRVSGRRVLNFVKNRKGDFFPFSFVYCQILKTNQFNCLKPELACSPISTSRASPFTSYQELINSDGGIEVLC